MNKNILIVGGTGFLGQNLVKKLSSMSYNITSLSSRRIPNKKKFKNVDYKLVDISKKNNFNKIKKNEFNYIINLGGNIDHKNKLETNKSHFIGCKNLLNELNLTNLKLFIQIGSSLEYGNTKSPQKENSLNKPKSIYGKAKLKATKYLISKSKSKNFAYIILRPDQIYGPHQTYDRLIPQTIDSCLKNKEFSCSEGKQLRDFLYVSDFVELVLKILKNKKINPGIYNIGLGRPFSVKYIIMTIKKIIKKGKPNFGKIKMRKDEIMSLYPNTNKTKKNFKWRPKVNIINGIKKTIKFYAEQ